MKESLLTERQMEVLRYRKKGLTQQQIADIYKTSKANICTIEKSAMDNIRKAKETLEFLYTLDAQHLCTLKAGSDLFESATMIFAEAGKYDIKVNADSLDLINRLRTENPKRIKGRHIREDIDVYLRNDGELYFT